MKNIKPLIALLLCSVILILPACKSVGKLSLGGSELKIGVEGIEGNFNPFYAESEADCEVVAQMFRPIQRRSSDNKLVNYSGGISYEFVGDSQVKYTVSIKDDMYFSDGTNITIDDVIFFYHFIADASYDGKYKNWYLNDIVGLKEYYFDDKDYGKSIAAIENTISEKFTVTTIGKEDYIDYLVATKLEGKMSGGLESASPSGSTWREYISKLGYDSELSKLGSSPSDEAVLKLAARVEAENNPLAYNPESWYREQLYTSYVKGNYDNGADVESIEGIKKVNDYTCTVLFNSRNINAISEINIPLVSKNYYSAEYIKGSAEKVKELSGYTVCSGPYVISDSDETSVLMSENEYYGGNSDFTSLKFIDLSADGDDPIESVLSGKVDVVRTLASSNAVNSLSNKSVQYFITNCDYYASLFFNTRSLSPSARKALMCPGSLNSTVEAKIGSYYTRPLRPISVRFEEYPSSVTEPYYSEEAFRAYSKMSGSELNELFAYYSGSQDDFGYIALTAYKDILASNGISLNIVLVDEQGLESAIISGQADIWLENVYDGATCDKYDYYNSSGKLNKTGINTPEINLLTEGIRKAVGFSDKAQMTLQLSELIMEQAIELPVYQLQEITVYNTETVNPESFSKDSNFDGFTYYIPLLKSN